MRGVDFVDAELGRGGGGGDGGGGRGGLGIRRVCSSGGDTHLRILPFILAICSPGGGRERKGSKPA